MNRLAALGRFLVDFVVGDDPWIAVCVLLAFLVTLGLADNQVTAWWLLPLVVAVVLLVSVAMAAAEQRRRQP